jgi:hypothetical protein
MGLDGGDIPKGSDMVLKKKKLVQRNDQKEIESSLLASYWTDCCLSGLPLSNQIFVSTDGLLFNKIAVLEAYASKSIPKKFKCLKKFSNLVNLNLLGKSISEYNCPISGKSPCHGFAFVCLRKCGHLFEKSALEMVGEKVCSICEKEFEDNDKIILSPRKNLNPRANI